MKRQLLSYSGILCLLFCVSVAYAQQKFLLSVDGYTASHLPDGLYYMDKDGSNLTHAANFLPYEVLGQDPGYFIQASDGEIVGINEHGGGNEEDGSDYYGTLYRVTAKGVIKIQNFAYAEASNTFIEQATDGRIHGIGPQPVSSYRTWIGTKEAGLTRGNNISTYGFYPGEMSAASTGEVFGTAPVGGAYAQGFIYKHLGASIQIVYSFARATGNRPVGKLLQGTDGYLYGVTERGGTNNVGVIFRVKTDGTGYSVLYNLNTQSGKYPDRGLVQDNEGYLYGVAPQGGTNAKGTVFRIKPDGTSFSVVYNFSQIGSYAITPQESLIFSDGFLYGIVPGGKSQFFRVNKNGSGYALLLDVGTANIHSFALPRQITPTYKVLYPANGASNMSTNIVVRTDSVPGAAEYILEVSKTADFANANRYHGTATTFDLRGFSPSTTYFLRLRTSLWDQPGPATSFTTGSSTQTGYSVVTTPANGASNVSAPITKVTVKAVSGATRYTVEINESAAFGANTISVSSAVDNQRTMQVSGLKYNTVYYARVKTNLENGYGSVTSFKTKAEEFSRVISPADDEYNVAFDVLKIEIHPLLYSKHFTLQLSTSSNFGIYETRTFHSLDEGQRSIYVKNLNFGIAYYARVKTDISTTWGPVTTFVTRDKTTGTRLYGLTAAKGENGNGALYSFSVDSLKFTKLYDIPADRNAGRRLEQTPDGIYGFYATQNGLSGNMFRYNEGSDVVVSADVRLSNFTDFSFPSNGAFFATIDQHSYSGKLKRINSDFSAFKDIYQFAHSPAGAVDVTAPLVDGNDGFLYGIMSDGGQPVSIYRIQSNGKGFQTMFTFPELYWTWDAPAPMTFTEQGYLVGTIAQGGNYEMGIIYKIRPDGTGFQVLHHFSGTVVDGAYPKGQLLERGGYLYGTASEGGQYGYGVVYRIAESGANFRVLAHLSPSTGGYPQAGVSIDLNGNLYGAGIYGGAHMAGTLFTLDTEGRNFRKLYDFHYDSPHYPVANFIITEDPVTQPAVAARVADAEPVYVYPNPSVTSFVIQNKSAAAKVIEITDFSGAVVYKGKIEGEDVRVGDDLPKGIYVMKIITAEGVTTERLLKQ